MIEFEDKLIGMTLIYVELVIDGKDIVICPTKRYKFILIGYEIFMGRMGKPLGCLIFFWVGDGLERRVGV